MTITHEEADEILAAFAMDALTGNERQDLIDHLAGCRLHDSDLAEDRAVVASLSLTAEEVAPPQRLRGRLLSNFDQEVRSARGRVVVDQTGSRAGHDAWRRPQFAYGLAAALLIVVVGLAAWNSLCGQTRARSGSAKRWVAAGRFV